MKGILAIDIGAGTQDILLYEEGKPLEGCLRLVLPSPTVIAAGRVDAAAAAGGGVHLAGGLMGGGPVTKAVRRAVEAGITVTATTEAALTLHDNSRVVRERGVRIVETPPAGAEVVELTDLDLPALGRALSLFEVELPRELAVAVQDHGFHPEGGNRRARFAAWKRFLRAGGDMTTLIYDEEIPHELTRMRAIRRHAPAALLCDTGTAAIWGALVDERVAGRYETGQPLALVNVGNAHALVFLIVRKRVCAVYEHHTKRLSADALRRDIERLLAGDISNDEVFHDGGHGAAYADDWTGCPLRETLLSATGPQRTILRGRDLHFAAPAGDQMMTGPTGLVRAFQATRGTIR